MDLAKLLDERNERFLPNDIEISKLERIDKIDFSGNIYRSNKKSNTKMILVKPGDLVISGINVSKGALSIYEGDKAVAATIHYTSYILNEKNVDKVYFCHLIKTRKFLKLLKDQIKGGIKTEIKAKQFLSLNFNLPTINEQKKIAFNIETNKSKIIKLEREVYNQKNSVFMLRKTLLYDIFYGRESQLTKELNLEPKSLDQDFKKILETKKKLKILKKIKKFTPLIAISDSEKVSENNNNLIWCRISDLFLLEKGFIGIKKAQQGAYPLVTTAEIRSSHKEYQFDGETILIPTVSSTGHGHASINRIHYQSGKFAVGSILCALSPIDNNLVNTKFYYHYLSLFKDDLIVSKMKGSANVSLTIERLSSVIIPFISIKLQKKFEEIFNSVQDIISNTDRTLELKKEFEKAKIEELII
jgi:restriction endonuclease S subunit